MRKFIPEKKKIRNFAYEKAYEQIWRQAYKEYLLDNPEVLTKDVSDKEFGIMDTYIKKVRQGYKFVMITVNPKEDSSFIDLQLRVKKCLKKVWVQDWLYCYEQRGDSEETCGVGVHTHIMIEIGKYKRPSDIRRECYNTFKHLVGNEQHVNCKFSMFSKNFVNYIKGEKKDIDGHKANMIKFDKLWRSDLSLPPFESSKEY